MASYLAMVIDYEQSKCDLQELLVVQWGRPTHWGRPADAWGRPNADKAFVFTALAPPADVQMLDGRYTT